MKMLLRFLLNEEGATAIEYGLIASLIAAAIVISVTGLGNQVKALFEAVQTQFP